MMMMKRMRFSMGLGKMWSNKREQTDTAKTWETNIKLIAKSLSIRNTMRGAAKENHYSLEMRARTQKNQEGKRGRERKITIMVDKWHWTMIQVKTSQRNKPTLRNRENQSHVTDLIDRWFLSRSLAITWRSILYFSSMILFTFLSRSQNIRTTTAAQINQPWKIKYCLVWPEFGLFFAK